METSAPINILIDFSVTLFVCEIETSIRLQESLTIETPFETSSVS